jgi:hypothetical protein
MPLSEQRKDLMVLFILMSATQLIALTPTPTKPHPSPSMSIRHQSPHDAMSILESLRKDIAAHPSDFITFETQSSANQFIVEHENEASHETDRRVVLRGIVGYWRSKTLVVLPSLLAATPW